MGIATEILVHAKDQLLVAQGHVSKGSYTIVYGYIKDIEPRILADKWVPKTFKNSNHYVPSKLEAKWDKSQPIVHLDPVPINDKANIMELLRKLGFKHYKEGEYAFYSEPRSTPIYPIIHMGLPDFKQDYVKVVYPKERIGKLVWPIKTEILFIS